MRPPQGLAQFQDEPLEEEQVKERILPQGSCVIEHPRGKRYHNEIKVSEPACSYVKSAA